MKNPWAALRIPSKTIRSDRRAMLDGTVFIWILCGNMDEDGCQVCSRSARMSGQIRLWPTSTRYYEGASSVIMNDRQGSSLIVWSKEYEDTGKATAIGDSCPCRCNFKETNNGANFLGSNWRYQDERWFVDITFKMYSRGSLFWFGNHCMVLLKT